MKKRYWFSALMAVVLTGIVTVQSGATPQTELNLTTLSKIHMRLDVPPGQAKMDKNAVLEQIKTKYADATSESKQVKIEYQLVTNPDFTAFTTSALEKNPELKAKGYMEKFPVYIVTFKGIHEEGHVPLNYKGQTPIHTEMSIVVDAQTGEELMGFSH
ncbi:hypothetical protein [Tumebacillus flagellatus]|uniref:PepSY domain-containing protein n=1 Tax=Tumebacillus flagellatus TaxID=1157490 RepID=A0A074LRH4_9BACL|nr:hypothetical protein [Tumebacillus flagellatus]KEO82438.1 hypothetical protein EL26_15275 [Tumebacillus flagellatus]